MSAEYKAAKAVITAMDAERKAAADLAFTYTQIIAQYKEMGKLDRDEKAKLYEIIENFRQQLKNRDETITELKKQKKYSILSKVKLVLVGVGIGFVVEKVSN